MKDRSQAEVDQYNEGYEAGRKSTAETCMRKDRLIVTLQEKLDKQEKMINEIFERCRITLYLPDLLAYPIEHIKPMKDQSELIKSELKNLI